MDDSIKTIIRHGDENKIIKFCSFACFENKNDSFYPTAPGEISVSRNILDQSHAMSWLSEGVLSNNGPMRMIQMHGRLLFYSYQNWSFYNTIKKNKNPILISFKRNDGIIENYTLKYKQESQ